MKRVVRADRMSWPALVLLVVYGCSSGDDANDANPVTAPGAVPTAGIAAAGVGGTAAGAAGATAGSPGTAGAIGAAGMTGAAGAAGAAGGSAGAAGTMAEPVVPDAGAPDADAPEVDRPPRASLMLPITMESPNVEPWFNVYRPTDLTATGEPLPVIVWANGGCFRSDFTWAPLFERWAAGGFIVLALTEGPDGPLVQSTVADQGGLIDWALEQAEMAGGPYAGNLDVERIVAAGNSCGGITALGLASDDDRVASVFVLSGSSAVSGADQQVISGISVPVGYIVGGSEDIAGANATADYEALADGIPAMIVSRSSGDHVTVSTDPMILPQVAEMALNWMDLALYGTPEASEALNSDTICTGCAAGTWTLTAKNLETLQQ